MRQGGEELTANTKCLLCTTRVKLFASNQIQTTLLELLSVTEAYNRGCKGAEGEARKAAPPPQAAEFKGQQNGRQNKQVT